MATKPRRGETPIPYEDMSREDFRAALMDLIQTDQTVTMTVTPLMADVMEEFNFSNRIVTLNRVREMSESMRIDNWKLTGQPIIFAAPNKEFPKGIMNTGQHRLRACKMAGVPFRTDVRFGIEREAFMFTDTGRAYRGSDVLNILGERNTTNLASALGWLHRWELGLPEANNIRVTNEIIAAKLKQHPEMRESVAVGRHVYATYEGFQPSLLGFVHYLVSRNEPQKAEAFFEIVRTGIGITTTDDPIWRLRNRMSDRAKRHFHLSPIQQIALMIKAWNFWMRDERRQSLVWREDEPFPPIIGMPHPKDGMAADKRTGQLDLRQRRRRGRAEPDTDTADTDTADSPV
jgi:hypothetical protein